jgi:hypothetical protein
MISAVNREGNKSPPTRPAYGYARVFGAPDAPQWVRLAPHSGRGHSAAEIKIEWEPSPEPDVYYAVYRSSSADSSLTRLTGKTTTAGWTDSSGLKPGLYYYYTIQTVKDDVSSGKPLKSQFSAGAPEGFILSPPDTVAAEKNGAAVIVKWLPPLGRPDELSRYTYTVYGDTSMNGGFTVPVQTGIPPGVDAEGYISAAAPGGAYEFFKVETENSGARSAKSRAVSPAPAAARIGEASRYAHIQENQAANSSGVYPVKITWKKPENENPAYYQVYRSTRSGAGFSRISGESLGAKGPFSDVYAYDQNTGLFTFIDKNETAKAGKKYYYRVLSLNQLEQGNFPSDERIGWGGLTHIQYLLEYNKTMQSALKKLTLMHKPGNTAKLGSESKSGAVSGSISYNAGIDGLGARIIIRLDNYADFYIENDPSKGVYFTLNGNSNTSANMSANGTMDGAVRCTGMYPGYIYYDRVQIKGGAAGGGAYGVHPDGGFQRAEVDWTVGEQ